ncbi:HGR012Wp [Eremothecium sinecaudum]|uniref:HGR012Wp n=1 Tax=Eremothecium sinecaudum TaxID=45286 RepID=A0A120K2R6_9SACH|nr:HGR012Wp [Eremothecium sinecaudum]AMD22351.1 HGR012Wp [Eremothecium sinecaudum]
MFKLKLLQRAASSTRTTTVALHHGRLICTPLHSTCHGRYYSESRDSNNNFANSAITKLMQQLQSSPKAKEAFDVVTRILLDKKLIDINSTKRPDTWQMIKLLIDPDVRAAMKNLSGKLHEAGIKLRKEDITTLMQLFKLNKK